MVEASPFFIVYEFLARYLSSFAIPELGAYAIMIWGGTSLLMVTLSLLLKDSSGIPGRILYAGTALFGLITFIFFLVSTFTLFRGGPEVWANTQLGLSSTQYYTYSFLILFGISGVIAGIASVFMSREPDNDSTMNARQILQLYAVVAAVLFTGIALWHWYPDVFLIFVIITLIFIEVISIFFWFYDSIIFMLSKGMRRKPKTGSEPTPGKANRFAIVICAHNEEKVIEYLIDSLHAMSYPIAKYEIFVVCDNCQDDTVLIAKDRGAIVLERNDHIRKGKNEALRWAFNVLEEKQAKGDIFDAYVVLNADNLVNEQYLNVVNEHLNQGHEVMQTYIGSKNPNDTWISKCTSIAYWLSNSSYQEAHSRLNLSAQLSGAGIVLRPEILHDLSWGADSLTEELTFTTKYLLTKNYPCHWVHTARIYDEKPLTLKASLRQRTRLMQGRMDTMMKYAPKLLISGIKNHSMKQIDMMIYLIKPLFIPLTVFVYALRWLLLMMIPGSIASTSLIMSFPIALILAAAYLLMQIYVLNSESNLRNAIWLPLYHVYAATWSLPIVRGFAKRHERFWVSSFHARSLTINEIPEDVRLNEARRRLAGLENLHRLPLGQILLKAAIITGSQLDTALLLQKKNGGYLGNILFEIGAISEETLITYVSIQQVMRESAKYDPRQLHTLQLGQILLNADLITEDQLDAALDHQKITGCRIGESIVDLRILPPEVLRIFLEVQNVIGANYLNEEKAQELIKGMVDIEKPESQNLEALLITSGMISKPQLESAHKYQKIHHEELIDSLLHLGYLSSDTLETIENVIASGKSRATNAKGDEDART